MPLLILMPLQDLNADSDDSGDDKNYIDSILSLGSWWIITVRRREQGIVPLLGSVDITSRAERPFSVWNGPGRNPIQTEWSGRFRELFSKPQKPSRGRVWALNGHLWTSRLLQWNQNKKKRETDNQFLLILSFSAAMPQFVAQTLIE